MSSSKLVRWSGWPAILSGVLVLVVVLVDLITINFMNLREEVTTPAYRFYTVLSLMATVLLLMGLVGLYFRQAEKVGAPGLFSFLVAFMGTALVVGAFWAQTFGAATLADIAPDVLDEPSSSGWLGPGFTLSFALFALGWVLFGIVTYWGRYFERWAAVLLALGAALSFSPVPYTEALFGVAIIWLGINNLSLRTEDTSEGSLARTET